jgi:hypothetical protein
MKTQIEKLESGRIYLAEGREHWWIFAHLLAELSSSWEAANYAATQELPSILRSQKVHYRVHKRPPLVPIVSQIDSVHTIPSYLRSILILSNHIRLGLPSGLFPSGFPTNILYTLIFAPIRATCPPNPIFLYVIILIMFGEEYKLWSYSLCSFLQSPVTSSLFGPNILLSILFSNILGLCSSLNVRDQVSHPYRTTGNIIDLFCTHGKKLQIKKKEKDIYWKAEELENC